MSQKAIDNLRRWKADPLAFVREVFQAEPDEWQKDTLNNFPKHQRLAMKACKGPGKTTVLAWLAWNFLATRPNPKIAATSISGDNLADGLWTEMAKWQHRSEFLRKGFTWTKTRIVANHATETHWMSARSWAKGSNQSQQANTLAGLHADHLMFILDESGGIPDAVMAAAEGGLGTGIETKLLQAGNPTHTEGPLYRACTTERHLWFVQEITADPDDPKRTPRVSVQWAKEQIEKYGRDNPWVLVNVFGKFPPTSLNSLLGPDEVSEAMERYASIDQFEFAQKRIGVDCARFGDDMTVLFMRQGLMAHAPIEMRNARTNDIAARVVQAKVDFESEVEMIDDTGGYGAGVIDSMIQAGQNPLPVNFSGKAIDPRYMNKRAEMWFLMAEWVKRGGCLPKSSELLKELTTPTYTFNNGKFQIEPKDQIKARLGYSCDRADALVLTFALPEMPKAFSIQGMKHKAKADYDFDPFREEALS